MKVIKVIVDTKPYCCDECIFCNAITADKDMFVCDALESFVATPRTGRLYSCPLEEENESD